MRYRKKPVIVEATRWFKNGGHPDDYKSDMPEIILDMAARIEALEKALEPFAQAWEAGGKRDASPKPVDFRTAARALKGEG
jgi:hypothetical protein